MQRVGALRRLAHLHCTDVRQAQDAFKLQGQLPLIELPQALADAGQIAVLDLTEALIDDAHITAIVEIELQRCQNKRYCRAEQDHADQKSYPDSAADPCHGSRRPVSADRLRCVTLNVAIFGCQSLPNLAAASLLLSGSEEPARKLYHSSHFHDSKTASQEEMLGTDAANGLRAYLKEP